MSALKLINGRFCLSLQPLFHPWETKPLKYHQHYCTQIIDFFSGDPYHPGEIAGLPPRLPTLQRFADSLGIEPYCLYEWSQEHKEFAHALCLAKQKQSIFLMDAGLAGIYPDWLVIFTVKNLFPDWGTD